MIFFYLQLFSFLQNQPESASWIYLRYHMLSFFVLYTICSVKIKILGEGTRPVKTNSDISQAQMITSIKVIIYFNSTLYLASIFYLNSRRKMLQKIFLLFLCYKIFFNKMIWISFEHFTLSLKFKSLRSVPNVQIELYLKFLTLK